jgi:hypothetical protein
MLSDHADAAGLNLADIEIVVDSVVVWGSLQPIEQTRAHDRKPGRPGTAKPDCPAQGNKSVRSSAPPRCRNG